MITDDPTTHPLITALADEDGTLSHTAVEIAVLHWLAENLPSIGAEIESTGCGPKGGFIAFEFKGYRYTLTYGQSDEIWSMHDCFEEELHREEQQALTDDSPNIPFEVALAKRPSQVRKPV
jgi:hypothetical protein